MGFGDAIRTCLKEKYITISGRASRSEYWWFYLFTMLMQIPVQIGVSMESWPIIIVGMVLMLLLLIPGFCAAVRRIHDKGRSGWWLLIVLVPIVGFFVVFYWFVTRGTEGDNDFGADPLA